ncbi:MAG: OmpP1/FadL family transporter [Candidatus Binatia bacterium]
MRATDRTREQGHAALLSRPVSAVRGAGRVVATLWLGVSAALVPTTASASPLLAPAVGAADLAMMGTRVADPPTPSAALFENPAGLTRFDTTTISSSLGIGYGWARVEASEPAGYKGTNTPLMQVPDAGLSIPYRDRWRFALGAYGSTGSKFDFDADPARGVGHFFSETIVATFPLGVAYRIGDHLSIGAEVEPLFGQLRTRFTLSDLDFHYKINGPGVQGMAGVTLRPTEQWALGLSVRTPGMIWMRGSMPVQGVGRQDVDLNLEMPTQVFLGATWHCTRRLTLSGSVRFTNSSTLGSSIVKYELTPQANNGFLPHAQDEWKFALAAEYALPEQLMLRFALAQASHIVGSRGVSPLVFDGDDTKIAVGLGRDFGRWVLDATAGYNLPAERHIARETALVLPGTYRMEGVIFMLGVTQRL